MLAGLFLVGVGAAFAKLRTHRSLLTLLWLAVGLAPALVVPVEYNTLHAIAAMPPVFLLIGLGVQTLTRVPTRRWHIATILLVILTLGFGVTGVRTAYAYFITWGTQRDVRVAYHHHVVALGRHLEQMETRSPVVITSLYPGEFHDPYTMEVTLKRQDLDLRWCDARYALIVPKATSRLYVEEQTTPTEHFAFLLDDTRQRVTTLDFGADAIPSQITGYQWESGKAWDDIQTTLGTEVYAKNGDPPPNLPHQFIEAPLNFGDTLTFVGYSIQVNEQPADSLDLLTFWQVIQPPDQRVLLFSHLLSPGGNLISQADQLDAPSWQWQSGDRFVQRHELQLPEAPSCSGCSVAVGLYVPATLTRLPVRTEEFQGHEEPAPTRLLIPLDPVMSQEQP
jgi:hypothetical protein